MAWWKPLAKWLIEQAAQWGIKKIGNQRSPAARTAPKTPKSK